MATAPYALPSIPPAAIPAAGEFLLPVCTTRDRLTKLINALNTYRNLSRDDDEDVIVDVLRALAYIQNPESSPCYPLSVNDCVEFPLSFSRIIEWIPNNPFVVAGDPDTFKPWHRADSELAGFLGLLPTDVVTGLWAITYPPYDPPEGVDTPRYRVTVDGTGTVELHMIQIPSGGMAQIQVDGRLDMLYYLDLNKDIVSLPPETVSINIQEFVFDTPGEHFIDVTMLPRIDDETELIGFGGGLRKIVLCGFDDPVRPPMFRFTDECGMEYRFTEADEWVPVEGWDEFAQFCFQGEPGVPGVPGEPGAPGEGVPGYDGDGGVPTPTGAAGDGKRCDVAVAVADEMLTRYKAFLDAFIALLADNANDYYAAYQELEDAFYLDIEDGITPPVAVAGALGYWKSVGFLMNAIGIGAVISGFLAYFAGKDVLNWAGIRADIDDSTYREELICLILGSIDDTGSIDADAWNEIKAAIATIDGASAAAKADFAQWVDKSIPVSLARRYALKLEEFSDCSFCTDPELCEPLDMMGRAHAIDFCFRERPYSGDWVPVDFNQVDQQWVAGEGWKSGFRTQSSVGYRMVQLVNRLGWPNRSVTNTIMRLEYTLTLGTTFGATTQYVYFATANGTKIVRNRTEADAEQPVYTQGNSSLNFTGAAGVLQLRLTAGQRGSSLDPGGEVTLHRFTILHDGTLPAYVVTPEL